MARKLDLPNHRELEERRKRGEAALQDTSARLEKNVKDVEIVTGIEDKLDMSGTADASEAILHHVERARRTAEVAAEQRGQEVDRVRLEGEDCVKDIEERAAHLESDAERIGDIGRRLDSAEVADEVSQAEREARRSCELLTRLAAESHAELARARAIHESLYNRLKALRR